MRSLSGGPGDVDRGEEKGRRGARREGREDEMGEAGRVKDCYKGGVKIREMGESVMISLGVDGG